MVKTQPIGSGCARAGLRAGAAPFTRAVDTRRVEGVRAEGDPDRPEDPLPEGLPEAPLDVRVAMLTRLTRRVVNRGEARRSGPAPTGPGTHLTQSVNSP
ncbi:hypothetical protein GCM10010517_77500 [Streptosporangium fragile]|uniref:Uncharacterized protein n=1 Tax=Streptosporangium fragile TaxID=46186 RepID=A0ABN3WC93_9ACTN